MITKNKTGQHLEHGDVDALTSARADLMHERGVDLSHGPKRDTPIGDGGGAIGRLAPIYHVRQPGNTDSTLG